jgi:hypothetical protein
MSKTWKVIARFSNYDDADKKRNEISLKTKTNESIVKVSRCGPGGSEFAVKYWEPPAPIRETQTEKPKGKKLTRGDKRAEKKARRRAREEQKGSSN